VTCVMSKIFKARTEGALNLNERCKGRKHINKQ